MLVGKPYWEARSARRVLAGKTTMFADAQTANREFLGKLRRELLAKHGAGSAGAGTATAGVADGGDARCDEARQAFESGSDAGDQLLGPTGGLEDAEPPEDRGPGREDT